MAPTPALERSRDERAYHHHFTPQAHGRTARGMRRRRTILGAMVWIAGGGVVAFGAMFLFYAGMFDFAELAPPQLGAGERHVDTLTMGQLQFTGFDKKNQAYSLAADSAEQDRDRPNIIHLTNVRAELKLAGSGNVVKVRADIGTYDTQSETMSVERNIKVITTQGFTALLETATITLKDGAVTSHDPVVVNTTTGGTLWANGMRLWDNARHIQFTNRVRAEFGTGTGSGRADAG
jgi:LPS export ABC transporter protein LptC